jgi:chromosome segregation ATPase
MVAAREDTRRAGAVRADQSAGAVSARIERAHERIPEFLVELERAGELAPILEVLEGLGQLLPGHFSDEEGPDGLYEELAARRPANGSRLRSLQREHREILEALERLRQQAREAKTDLSDVWKARNAFVERVRSHERRESRLVMDTCLVDDGGSG